MKFTFFAAAAIGATALFAPVKADYDYPDVANAFDGYELVFADEFNDGKLDPQFWTADWDCSGWGNEMRACYTTSPNNLFFKDGMLNINPIYGRLQPDHTKCGPGTGVPPCCCEESNFMKMDATSAQVTTRQKFAFNQGRLRVRAKMSTGYYTWPAIWLFKDWAIGGPISEFGEIDIQEGVGKMPKWWSAVVHYPKENATGGIVDGKRYENQDYIDNLNEDFHVFGLDWTDKTLTWSIDENVMWKWNYGTQLTGMSLDPFINGQFHILLDTAVGGRMFGIGYGRNNPSYDNLGADADTWTPTQFDYVRLYQQKDRHSIQVGPGPDILKGSGSQFAEGATCLYDGCVGGNWDSWVADYEKHHNGAHATAAPPVINMPTASPVATGVNVKPSAGVAPAKSTFAAGASSAAAPAPAATSGAAPAATQKPAATQAPPSAASDNFAMISTLAVGAAVALALLATRA